MSLTKPGADLVVEDFSAGYLDTPAPDGLPKGAAQDGQNVFFARLQVDGTRRATLAKRPGSRLLNPTAISAGKSIDGLVECVLPAVANQLVAVCDGTAYKYDSGTSAFVALTGGAGFTPGYPARFLSFRNNLYVTDGTVMKRYNGSCFTVGFAAPTGAPTLTTAGVGLTGTYEGYAVWYDSATDHESSPGPLSAAVALVNQQRVWAKPAGAPPANVTHWRVYCRRTDTNEVNYFLVATVAVGTASFQEVLSDAARRIAGTGPGSTVNNPPTVNYTALGTWKGFAFGLYGTNLYVSKGGDAESWDPKDVVPIRGGGRNGTSLRSFKRELLVQTPTKTFHLVGDGMPFLLEELHSDFGNVAPEAGVEVGDFFYGWDERQGPYRTNGGDLWEPLAPARIEGVLGTVNRAALTAIRAEHDPVNHLVIWAVPQGASTRCRTLLAFHYLLGVWLPPITGLEYATLARFTDGSGLFGLYAGDQWGRVYQLFTGLIDGPPSGVTSAAVTVASPSTVQQGAGNFYATGSGLAGMLCAVISPLGAYQWRRIQSNTASTITLDTLNGTPWDTVPADGAVPGTVIGDWTVVVGGYPSYWVTAEYDWGDGDLMKRGRRLTLDAATGGNSQILHVDARFNKATNADRSLGYTFTGGGGGLWGISLWGSGVWGSGPSVPVALRLERAFYDVTLCFWNHLPGETWALDEFHLIADPLPRRRARGPQ